MSRQPPHSGMRRIKRQAIQRRIEQEAALAASAPASVDEAIEEAAAAAPEPEPEATPEPEPEATPEPEDGEDDDAPEGANMDMKRSELNALAEEAGVESPGDLPNKKAVIDAINAAQGDD